MDRWARLAERVGTALLEFSRDSGPGTAEARGGAAAPVRGHRQQQVMALDGMLTEGGMTTGDVARLINYDQPNVYNTMHKLREKDLVELIKGSSPQRWRRVDCTE